MMHFADTSRGKHYAKDPAVVRLGGRYLMYYSIPPFEEILPIAQKMVRQLGIYRDSIPPEKEAVIREDSGHLR